MSLNQVLEYWCLVMRTMIEKLIRQYENWKCKQADSHILTGGKRGKGGKGDRRIFSVPFLSPFFFKFSMKKEKATGEFSKGTGNNNFSGEMIG